MLKPLLLLTALLTAAPQTPVPQPPDQSKLLANIRSRYDLPWQNGLASFACTVQFDWNAHLTASLHRPVPATDPIVKALTTARSTVNVTPAGAQVSTSFQDPQPPAAANGLEQSLSNVLTSGLASWLPISSGSILPVGRTNYLILPTEDGYRIDLTGDKITGTLTLDRNYVITRTESKLPGQTVQLQTTYTPGARGLQLTSLHTLSTPTGKPAADSTLALTYQTVNTFAIPQTLVVQARNGNQWTILLSGCSTTRTTP
jgi:hypothetical protein